MNIEDHLGNVLFFFFPHELVDSVALLKVAMDCFKFRFSSIQTRPQLNVLLR